jgi:protein involved in ribonucleotide reduction
MKIAYLSLTGNIRKFVHESLGVGDAIEIPYSDPIIDMDEDFVLIVPSYDDETTELVCEFLENNSNYERMVGVVGSGNRNFDTSYCFSAKEISERFKTPLLLCFEFSGNESDIMKFRKEVEKIEVTRVKKER